MSDLDLLPDDDSLIRTALRGLRVPPHHPDFWDQLAWQLDDAADEMALPELADPEPSPHHVEDPWTDTEEAAAAAHAAAVAGHGHEAMDLYAPVAAAAPAVDLTSVADHPPRREPLRATTRVFVDAPAAAPAPAAGAARAARIGHDAAVVPRSLRSASNAVLLAVVVVGALIALLAGLALVHSRSDAGSPSPTTVVSSTPTTTPFGAAAAVP
jgi:hypothetical protein